MNKYLKSIVFPLMLMSASFTSQAGHLFTQASLNTPVLLNSGFGIDIPQLSLEGFSSSGYISLNVSGWGTGDKLQITIGSLAILVDFDNLMTGWSQSSFSIFTNSSTSATAVGGLSMSAPFTWRMDALAGSFTLTGFRIGTAAGTIDGTGAGTVNQSQVSVTQSVPEPSTLAIFALGIMGLASRRFKKSS